MLFVFLLAKTAAWVGGISLLEAMLLGGGGVSRHLVLWFPTSVTFLAPGRAPVICLVL